MRRLKAWPVRWSRIIKYSLKFDKWYYPEISHLYYMKIFNNK